MIIKTNIDCPVCLNRGWHTGACRIRFATNQKILVPLTFVTSVKEEVSASDRAWCPSCGLAYDPVWVAKRSGLDTNIQQDEEESEAG